MSIKSTFTERVRDTLYVCVQLGVLFNYYYFFFTNPTHESIGMPCALALWQHPAHWLQIARYPFAARLSDNFIFFMHKLPTPPVIPLALPLRLTSLTTAPAILRVVWGREKGESDIRVKSVRSLSIVRTARRFAPATFRFETIIVWVIFINIENRVYLARR